METVLVVECICLLFCHSWEPARLYFKFIVAQCIYGSCETLLTL